MDFDVQFGDRVAGLVSLFYELGDYAQRGVMLVQGVGEFLSGFVQVLLQVEGLQHDGVVFAG